MRFKGKSALVTGGSEGIGFAIAKGLVDEGARVVISARREEPLRDAVAKLGTNASYVIGDISDAAAPERMVSETVARHGGLDLLVNNAGVLVAGELGQLERKGVEAMIAINLTGTVMVTDAAVKVMKGRPGASILMISSVVGQRALPGAGVYSATKAAEIQLTRVWAIELAKHGIRINALCPGPIDTPAFRAAAAAIPGFVEMTHRITLLSRVASTDELVPSALLLLDERAGSFTTGAVWEVDGGYLLA